MEPGQPLTPAQLSRRCDPEALPFETTAELEPLDLIPGQARAVEAIEFATGMPVDGHNLYVQGAPGTGRHTFVSQHLDALARAAPRASDWCYVNCFDAPRRPHYLELPAGRGPELRDDVERLVEDVRAAVPAAFQGEDFQTRKAAIEEAFQEEQEAAIKEVEARAKERGIGIMQTPTGFAFAPLKDDEPMDPEDYHQLSEEEQARIKAETEAVGKEIRQVMQSLPRRVREVRDRVRELEREVTRYAVGGLVDELVEKYKELPAVEAHLEKVRDDIVEKVEIFAADADKDGPPELGPLGKPMTAALRRYGVNLLVTQGELEGAPVVYEDHPTLPALIGRIEHRSQFGTLVTDLQLIEAGALHRANGGYLVLDARKVLSHPWAWEGLKRALRSGELRIQSLGEALSLVSTVSLEPQPIPLRVKVVLIGDPLLYYLLQTHDPEFAELFKVTADFDDRMERTPESELELARLVGDLARRESLLPLDRGAVARLIEQCARRAGDADRLSTRIRYAADLTREAHYHATREGRERIGRDDVQAAVDARLRRGGRVRDRVHESIQRGTVLVDTEGARAGQVNGLAVYALGEMAFARPSRITARVSLGSGDLVDIEREAKLGGPTHSKGVLILAGYLRARYAGEAPLSLHASLVFEQSYGGVDGDSASAAELCAILSALAEAPIRQGLAITGSVNQHGEIQAIGGVNEKIEGFFDVCHARGLTGDQGVLIPAANVKHLMLRDDVVAAAAAGKFHVYPMTTVEDCLARLTGLPAAELDARVRARLDALAEKRRAFGKKDDEEKPS